MPHFDGTVTLGNLLELGGIVVVLLRMYHNAVIRFVHLETIIQDHSQKLVEHGQRMEKYEGGMFRVVSDVQRLVGRLESQPHPQPHRTAR